MGGESNHTISLYVDDAFVYVFPQVGCATVDEAFDCIWCDVWPPSQHLEDCLFPLAGLALTSREKLPELGIRRELDSFCYPWVMDEVAQYHLLHSGVGRKAEQCCPACTEERGISLLYKQLYYYAAHLQYVARWLAESDN